MDKNLPQYSRERLLGEGGMGKVYLARDNQLQRQVAIKELTYQPQDDDVNHALQEARLLARVSHANIIQIFNVHDEGDHISLVMEYFESKTLTQFQLESYCTLIQKLDLLQQLAAGLAAAHKNGVIHCDLKPSNILVNDQGQLKITDFGIALLAPSETSDADGNTSDESEAPQYGSLLFMSPEQIKQQTVDYRTDIFSFGILAYQLVVGTHPFAYANNAGSANDVAKRICDHTPEHAKNLMLNAPSALTDLLMEMLVKPLEQRTITASGIENRLQHVRAALMQAAISEEETLPVGGVSSTADIAANQYGTQPIAQALASQNTQNTQNTQNIANSMLAVERPTPWVRQNSIAITSMTLLCLLLILLYWFTNTDEVEPKQVVILKPTLSESSDIAPMQQDLVVSAVEDALRQAVINTKDMYLISQREVKAITKEYPDDLQKLRQATGASDIISTELECDNNRCKVGFSRLVAKTKTSDKLTVKSEKNWLAPIDKFNAIFSTSQTQFASLFPEHDEVNQSGLVQKPIKEEDYREYIALYSQIKGRRSYNPESLSQLESLLTRSPYLYAAYGLYRDTAIDLYFDSQDKKYLQQLELILQNTSPEYRYSVYHAIDSFWLASYLGNMELAKQQITEVKSRGADTLIDKELNAYFYYSNNQYESAVNAYKEILKLRKSTRILYNLALTYWKLSDLNEAEKALTTLLVITPNHYAGQRLQANIWLMQGDLELAISAYEKIVASKNSGIDLTNLSMAYGLNKQYQKSIEFARKALSKNPKHPVDLLNLADIEMILGHKESAKAHYQQVISILVEKNELEDLTYLAQAYAQLNQTNLAIATLSKAQKLTPESGLVYYSSAIVYSLLEEEVSAVHHVKMALKNNIGVVWFNLPWFDRLCSKFEFANLMNDYNNPKRCKLSSE